MNMHHFRRAVATTGKAVIVALFALSTAQANTVATEWNETLLQAVRDSKLGPPMVARALAVTHTSMYEAWAAYDARAVGTRTGASLRQPRALRTEANKEQAVSYAAYKALVDIFPAQSVKFRAKMISLGYDPDLIPTNPRSPVSVGITAANAVIAFRHNDGANQLGNLSASRVPYDDYTGYVPANSGTTLNDPNKWQPLTTQTPTGPVVQKYVAPHWYLVAPFAMKNGREFRPKLAPAKVGSRRYIEQAEDIMRETAALTEREKAIAEYWADGPTSELPPGHWCLFAQFVSERDGHTLDQDIKMYFVLTNALHDAAIAAWDAKRYWDSVRPVTAIRYAFATQVLPWYNDQVILGKQWSPYQPTNFLTPPFSEYISGHSTFSAAAAEVLRRFTGSSYFGYEATVQPGSSKVEPGISPQIPVILAYRTFAEAAEEAGMSRRYGGIHFKDGDLEGRKVGKKVGQAAWRVANTKYFKTPSDDDDQDE